MTSDAEAASRTLTRAGLGRLAQLTAFALVPAFAVVFMFWTAHSTGPLALDFVNELYPIGDDLLSGDNPYPEALWPPLAGLLTAPLTVLPVRAAAFAVAVTGLVCMALALRVTGVRDWRVYGVVALWPPVLADIRIAHLTPLLCLLVALTWRYRHRTGAGVALGLAGGLKFFLWPLGIWLLATRRYRAAAVAAVLAVSSVLLVELFASVGAYLETLDEVRRTFDQDAYSIFGLMTRLGGSESAAHAATFALGGGLLVLTWRSGSFALAVAAALVLSPIVWLDFFALAAIPLAVARPTLSVAWLVPLASWGLPSSAIGVDEWRVAGCLVVFTVVLAVASTPVPSVGDERKRG